MTEEKEVKILTIYLGDTDIYEWTQGVGKSILMPQLLIGCEKMIDENLEDYKCARVEVLLRGNPKAFDFAVDKTHVNETLSKILEWSLEEEEYEMCQRVKDLQEKIQRF
jgi:hypothetical protein